MPVADGVAVGPVTSCACEAERWPLLTYEQERELLAHSAERRGGGLAAGDA